MATGDEDFCLDVEALTEVSFIMVLDSLAEMKSTLRVRIMVCRHGLQSLLGHFPDPGGQPKVHVSPTKVNTIMWEVHNARIDEAQ